MVSCNDKHKGQSMLLNPTARNLSESQLKQCAKMSLISPTLHSLLSH